jgi:hypothetical protein
MAPGMPNLPGPYYAVDIGCSGVHAPHTGHDGPDTPDDTGCALLRLVMVDNGITGSIDVDQADWIATMLRGPLPKVVVTGRPVVVNNKINRFTVAEDGNLRTGDRRPRDLISLMADGSNVVATLAGDVHNYQRFLLPATTETGDPSKLPPVQIVAGGGGAYLAATHHTRLDAHDALPLELKRAPWPAGSVSAAHAEARRPVTGPMKLTVDGGQHTRFPDREDSVRLFGARVHRSHALTSFVVTLIALLAGYGVLFWAGRLTDESPLDTRISLGTGSFSAAYLVVWPFLVLAYVGLLSGACLRINATVHRWPKRVILLVVLMVAIAVAWLAFRDRSEAEMRGLAIGLLEVAALLLAPFVAPLLRGFPRLGGKTLLALIGALFVLRCVQVLGDLERATELALAGIAYVAVVVGVWWYKRLGDLLTKRQFLQTGPSFYSLVHRVVPMALVVVPAVFFTLIAPREGAELVGIDLESDADDAIRMLSALTGLLLLTGILAAVYVVPARRAWRTIPRHALVVSVAAGALLVATVATFWLGERDSQLDWKDVVLLVVACVVALVLGLLLGLLVCQVMALALGQAARPTRPPDPEKVAAALRYRDVGGNPPDRSYRLAGAMITADVPSLESLAEASQPPFGKNILVLSLEADHEETRIRFDAYGLYDESPPERGCYSVPRLPPGATAPVSAERGLFAIDAVTLRRRHSDPEWEVV